MRCPSCQSESKVLKTTHASGVTRRKLICKKSPAHRFETEEQQVGLRLGKDIHLRHRGDGKISLEPFDPGRLLLEVGDGVVGRLTPTQISNAVDAALAQLSKIDLPRAQALSGKEYNSVVAATGATGPKAWIYDQQVRDAVEYQLRKTNRIAHILYALAFLGRPRTVSVKGQGRTRIGWRGAEDFLAWLYDDRVYDDLREPIPERSRPAIEVWQPSKPTLPTRVVKREGRDSTASKSGGSGGTVDFLESRFIRSIEMAMLGRPDAAERSVKISWWVLHELVGQHTVHSSQLAIGVLNCLRRVDDIAYLRWAIQVKDLKAVREIKTEATGLIEWPSDRLSFARNAPPRKLTTTREHESDDSHR